MWSLAGLILLVVLSSAAVVGCPQAPDPLPEFLGSYSAKVCLQDFDDGSQFTIHYPESDKADETFPVIIFSGGWNLSRSSYDNTTDILAQWGYIVITRFYPTLGVWSYGRVMRDDHLSQISRIIDWCAEENERPESVLFGKVDVEHVGLVGHSFGAEISIYASLCDPRIDAVVSLDALYGDSTKGFEQTGNPAYSNAAIMYVGAADGGYCSGDLTELQGMEAAALTTLRSDVLNVLGLDYLEGADWDALASLDWSALSYLPELPSLDYMEPLFDYTNAPTVEVIIDGAGHMDFIECFVDQGVFGLVLCQPGTRDATAVRAIARRYYIPWFNVQLKGQDEYAAYYNGSPAEEDMEAGLTTVRKKLQ